MKATGQAKGLPVNDDQALEKEADEMGRKAAQEKTPDNSETETEAGKKTEKGDTNEEKICEAEVNNHEQSDRWNLRGALDCRTDWPEIRKRKFPFPTESAIYGLVDAYCPNAAEVIKNVLMGIVEPGIKTDCYEELKAPLDQFRAAYYEVDRNPDNRDKRDEAINHLLSLETIVQKWEQDKNEMQASEEKEELPEDHLEEATKEPVDPEEMTKIMEGLIKKLRDKDRLGGAISFCESYDKIKKPYSKMKKYYSEGKKATEKIEQLNDKLKNQFEKIDKVIKPIDQITGKMDKGCNLLKKLNKLMLHKEEDIYTIAVLRNPEEAIKIYNLTAKKRITAQKFLSLLKNSPDAGLEIAKEIGNSFKGQSLHGTQTGRDLLKLSMELPADSFDFAIEVGKNIPIVDKFISPIQKAIDQANKAEKTVNEVKKNHRRI